MLRLVGYPVTVQLGLPLGDHTDPLAPFVPSAVEFYFVRHQFARRYLLRVDGDGRVRVTIPRGGSRREATAFGLRHLNWIAGQPARIQRPGLNADERRGLQARANVELPARLRDLAAMHGLAVSRVTVRNQRTRWGSCGRNGHITLNWRLTLMPEWVRDYLNGSRADALAPTRPLEPLLAPRGEGVSRPRKGLHMAACTRAVAPTERILEKVMKCRAVSESPARTP